ncbi:MAG: hypothetical protein MUF72_18570 [Elainella sp. Prado103]|jgi:hypothetical protein|nr:hypothetical protein [Elainella sp. Prado103]
MADSIFSNLMVDRSNALSWHDRVQIGLGMAEPDLLRSLLVNCTPPIAQLHRIGGISSTIGVPTSSGSAIDGVIEFEEEHCRLVESPQHLQREVTAYGQRQGNPRGYVDLLRCESDTQTLGQMIPCAQAIATLTEAGFTPQQVGQILHLSLDAWFKSWWYQADEMGVFTIPFLRLMRSRHYADGTVTLQYKDFFAQEQPPCFKSRHRRVLIDILPELQSFQSILTKINLERQQTGIPTALVISHQIPDLVAQGLMSQGISLFASHEIAVPTQANCFTCATANCPMQGNAHSPVLFCRRFCLEGIQV